MPWSRRLRWSAGSPPTPRRPTSTTSGGGSSPASTSPRICAAACCPRTTSWATIEGLPIGIARQFHACTHTTFSPNIVHGGSKINTIPDTVDLQVDIRTLPGQTAEDVEAQLREAVGDLADDVDVHRVGLRRRVGLAHRHPAVGRAHRVRARASTRTARPCRCSSSARPTPRFFRRLGATAYGYGLFSRNLSFEDYSTMFHGDDERVDQESLGLSTELWQVVARELLG